MLRLCEIHMQIGPNTFNQEFYPHSFIHNILNCSYLATCIMTNLSFWSTTFNNGCILLNVSTDCMMALFKYDCSIN